MVAGGSNLSVDHSNSSGDEELPTYVYIIMHVYLVFVLFNLQMLPKQL